MKNSPGQAWLPIVAGVALLALLLGGAWYIGKRLATGQPLLTPSEPAPVAEQPAPSPAEPAAPAEPLPSTGPEMDLRGEIRYRTDEPGY